MQNPPNKLRSLKRLTKTPVSQKESFAPDHSSANLVVLNKNILIEKFSIAIKLKYSKLFKEKNYSTTDLIRDLSLLIDSHKGSNLTYENYAEKFSKDIFNRVSSRMNVNNSEVSISLPNIEKSPMKSLHQQNIPLHNVSKSINQAGMLDLLNNYNNSLGLNNSNNGNANNVTIVKSHLNHSKTPINNSKVTNINTNGYDIDTQLTNSNYYPHNTKFSSKNEYEDSINKINPPNQKLRALKVREQDIWGKVAKDQYSSLLEDNKRNQQQKVDKCRELSQTLLQQINEKSHKVKEDKFIEDQRYSKIQVDLNKIYDQRELDKTMNFKEKEAEIFNNRQQAAKHQRLVFLENLEKEKSLDSKLLDNTRKEIDNDREKKQKKKEDLKKHYEKVMESQKLKEKLKLEEKKNEEDLEVKKQRELEEIIATQNKQREDLKNNVKERFMKNIEFNKNNSVALEERIQQEFEENRKYVKDKQEQELRYLSQKKEKEAKKREVRENVLKALESQVEFKKKVEENEKEELKKEKVKVTEEREKTKKDLRNELGKSMDIRSKYKRELESQIASKIEKNSIAFITPKATTPIRLSSEVNNKEISKHDSESYMSTIN